MEFEIKKFNSFNDHPEIKSVLINNHYLGNSIPKGCKHWYALIHNGKIIGLNVLGIPVGRNVVNQFGPKTLELRRFVLLPEYNGKNLGSWFISRCLKELKEYNIISYCDTSKGFSGGLYCACNFMYLGKQRQGSTRKFINGKIVFAQGGKAKTLKANLIYMPKKDIWFYPARK